MNCIFSQTFFTKEPIYNLTLEIYASFLMCVCVLFLLPLLLQIICQKLGCWDIVIERIFLSNISTIYMICLMYKCSDQEQWTISSNFTSHYIFGYYFMYYYNIFCGDNDGNLIYILEPMFYVLNIIMFHYIYYYNVLYVLVF